ncbi:MAG: internalization-related competence protein ComEC/Rec2 [Clostridia bacterium]|nr:internalization-related competence protein ComEC/Rec2 [Clostridia bacterium]
MNNIVPPKYILPFLAAALYIGCVTGSRLYNAFILAAAAVLVLLLLFINRKNTKVIIVPALMLALIFGAFRYGIAADSQSSLKSFEGQAVTIEGVVAGEPSAAEYGQKFTLKDVYYVDKDKLFKAGEKLLVYAKAGETVNFGDRIRMYAELEPAAKTRNFGDFEFDKYYQSKNIYMRANPQKIIRLAENKAGMLSQLLYSGRQRIRNIIYRAMPEQEADILYGILTGDKSEIDEEVMNLFSVTGLAHLLSVSGLHIGFLVLIVTYILKPFKLKEKTGSIITFFAALFYILLIGAPIPALRALLMFAVLLGSKLWGQEYDLNTSASFAVIVLLLYNPLFIHDPSFIISFACIYAISFLQQPISIRLAFLPSWLRSSLSLSFAVWIGITPVLAHYFNYVSIINILLNVAAVPLAFVITLAGFAAVLVGMVLPFASVFIFSVSYYFIRLLYFISEQASMLPGAGFQVPDPAWYSYLLYYGAAFMLVEGFWKYRSTAFKRRYSAALGGALALILLLNLLPGRTLSINYIDVGQGDCSVVRTPNKSTIVIDGGGNASWQTGSYDIGQRLTVPALLNLGIWKVDTIIISHVHDDHIGGTLAILESFKVDRVVLPEISQYPAGEYASDNYNRLLELCSKKKVPISYLKKGDRIVLSKGLTLDVLGPELPYIINTDSDVNNNSLVLKLRYKDFDALFTGDIQQEGEQRISKEKQDVDVLKVSHHGSPYSSTKKFLDLVKPEFSIISVGKNIYGHPSEEAIERLHQAGSIVYRTDKSGGVMITTDGERMKLRTVRNGDVDER